MTFVRKEARSERINKGAKASVAGNRDTWTGLTQVFVVVGGVMAGLLELQLGTGDCFGG